MRDELESTPTFNTTDQISKKIEHEDKEDKKTRSWVHFKSPFVHNTLYSTKLRPKSLESECRVPNHKLFVILPNSILRFVLCSPDWCWVRCVIRNHVAPTSPYIHPRSRDKLFLYPFSTGRFLINVFYFNKRLLTHPQKIRCAFILVPN